MPIEIVILLLVAVAGIAGSIVLLVFNASLQRAAADGPQDEEEAFFPDGLRSAEDPLSAEVPLSTEGLPSAEGPLPAEGPFAPAFPLQLGFPLHAGLPLVPVAPFPAGPVGPIPPGPVPVGPGRLLKVIRHDHLFRLPLGEAYLGRPGADAQDALAFLL